MYSMTDLRLGSLLGLLRVSIGDAREIHTLVGRKLQSRLTFDAGLVRTRAA